MTVWYDPANGKIVFYMTDDAYAEKHELEDMWRSSKAKDMKRLHVPTPPAHPIKRYRVTEVGELSLLPEAEWPENRRAVITLPDGSVATLHQMIEAP